MNHAARLMHASATALLLLVIGCGGHKKVAKAHVPDAPGIAASSAPSACASCQPASPTVPPLEPETSGRRVIYTETGLASWYGPPYHNRRGANGEIYDMNALTAAHKTLPLNSIARVTNEQTGHSVVVRITDRGPFIGERMLDLSLAAAKAVDVWRPGVAKVKLEVLETPAPIESGGRWCVQIGAFSDRESAATLKSHLQRRYQTANVIEFTGPTGEWVRIRPKDDDRDRAREIARSVEVNQGGVFLVRLD